MQWSSLQNTHGRRARLERSRDIQPVPPTLPVRGDRGAEPVDDRRVDLAAAYAAPELLAIRDRLLVALAFSSGVFEAICFLSFGKVFTAFQTGNLVFLGLGVAGTRPPAGPDPVRVVISLAAFAVGAALATRILTAFNGDQEMEDSEVFEAWPRRVSIALCVATVAQVGFLVVWMATSPSSLVSNILVALNAFAMGLQMNAVRSLHVPGISTTAATATFISWISGISTWTLKPAAARRLTGVLVGMVAGAFVGDWMLSHAHTYAPVLPVVVIALVIVIASVAMKQKPAR
jgi:uncharacterized membrane protein YoaK (UPF0700 family)